MPYVQGKYTPLLGPCPERLMSRILPALHFLRSSPSLISFCIGVVHDVRCVVGFIAATLTQGTDRYHVPFLRYRCHLERRLIQIYHALYLFISHIELILTTWLSSVYRAQTRVRRCGMRRGGDRSSRHAWIPWECMWGCMRTKTRYVVSLVSLSLPSRPYRRVDTYLNIGYFEFC